MNTSVTKIVSIVDSCCPPYNHSEPLIISALKVSITLDQQLKYFSDMSA